MQWAIGDWYNAIPHGDKEAACNRVGLNYNSAISYGRVAATYQIHTRIQNCSFDRHKSLIDQKLTESQRIDLLEKSMKDAWTRTRLNRERDKLLGKPERVPVQNFNEQVQAVLAQLPASASKKTRKQIEAFIERLKNDFQEALYKITLLLIAKCKHCSHSILGSVDS